MTTPDPQSKPSLLKILAPIAVILALVVGGLSLIKSQMGQTRTATTSSTAPAAAAGGEIAVGSTLPDFSVKQFGGALIHHSELKSKVQLINFWATWCEACVVEMPSIVKLQHSFPVDKGFQVLPLNVDENPEAVLPKSIQHLGIDFPVFTDPDSKLAEIFDVHAIPLTAIINHDRKVLMLVNGEYDWNSDEIHTKLAQWLSL